MDFDLTHIHEVGESYIPEALALIRERGWIVETVDLEVSPFVQDKIVSRTERGKGYHKARK